MNERIGLRLGKGMRARLRQELVILGMSGADMARALGIDLGDWLEVAEGRAGVDDTLYFAMRNAGIDMAYVLGGFRDKVVTPSFLSSRGVNRAGEQPSHPATGSMSLTEGLPMYRAYRLEIPASYAVLCAVFLAARAAPHGSSNQGALAALEADYRRLCPSIVLTPRGADCPEDPQVLAQRAVNAGRVYGGDYPSLPVPPEHSGGAALLLVSANAVPTDQSCANECLFLMPSLGLSPDGLLESESLYHRPLVLWRGREMAVAPVTLIQGEDAA